MPLGPTVISFSMIVQQQYSKDYYEYIYFNPYPRVGLEGGKEKERERERETFMDSFPCAPRLRVEPETF